MKSIRFAAALSLATFATATGLLAQKIWAFQLRNENGVQVEITNYGGIITKIIVPDRHGHFGDIALGYHTVGEYQKGSPYFGATIGRYANRIAKGSFSLDGKTYAIAQNNAPGGIPCHLHGGKRGFDKVVWNAERTNTPTNPGLIPTGQLAPVDGTAYDWRAPLPLPQRLLPGNPTLPRLAQPTELPQHDPAPWNRIQFDDDLPLLDDSLKERPARPVFSSGKVGPPLSLPHSAR